MTPKDATFCKYELKAVMAFSKACGARTRRNVLRIDLADWLKLPKGKPVDSIQPKSRKPGSYVVIDGKVTNIRI